MAKELENSTTTLQDDDDMEDTVSLGALEDDIYQTISWIQGRAVFWNENHVCVEMTIGQNGSILQFANLNYNLLLRDLTSKNQNIFLEWCQHDTGSYLYYDLLSLVKFSKSAIIDLDLLQYSDEKYKNKKCIKPLFNESVPIKDKVLSDDILVLSPIRQLLLRFTEMGTFHKHKLYLSGLPSNQFIIQCNIQYLYNCCSQSYEAYNDDDVNVKEQRKLVEHFFDVSSWRFGRIEDDSDDDDDSGDDDVKNGDGSEEVFDVRALQMKYLDKKIDLIDMYLREGNVVIHCLAGAHRSPFITACYIYKYGQALNDKNAKEIYDWLVERRSIVQPLGYDIWLTDYQKYLQNKNK